ncbi:MAG: glutamate synthase large subunit, partial [Gammaproteobacteria bacterium]|nr:glutamate synthase large subunit [Gammaproteobacteria bacterium]
MNMNELSGLYSPSFEKENCGFGLIANMDGVASHWLVQTSIESLGRLTHRGAIAADGKTGDGCGLLMKLPIGFLRAVADETDISLADTFAAGCVFFNTNKELADMARDSLEANIAAQGLAVAGWRVVPTDPSACGEEALKSMPHIEQVFVNAPAGLSEADFERKLYVARRLTEKAIEPKDPTFYIP